MGFQQMTVMGQLAKDFQIKQTQNGKQVGLFSIPVTEKWEGGEHTEWFNCTVWGDRAQKLAQYLPKGKAVVVTGTLKTREHDGKRFTSLNVDKLQFAGDAKNMGQPQQGYQQPQYQAQPHPQQSYHQQESYQPQQINQPGNYGPSNLEDIPF